MKTSTIPQGPWTRVRPLQRDELDPYTRVGMVTAEITWGDFRNNMAKVMAYCPRLMQTEVAFANSFIFDPPTFRGEVQEAGFNDRFIKELAISKVSLTNRCHYSVSHHAFIGMETYRAAGREEEAHEKYLHLHEHREHPQVYTERERVVLDYAENIAIDAHRVTDDDFAELRRVLREHNLQQDRLKHLTEEELARFVDAQVVELTWVITMFCGVNRCLTVLQVHDETAVDEDNFSGWYAASVPEDIRQRNEQLVGDVF